MKRPSLQFYPDTWRNNANLRRCSWQARGVWIEVLCLMHDSDDYGVLHWPIKEIAKALGCKPNLLQELVEKCVLKGADSGAIPEFIYVPRSGRKDGDPVTLVAAQDGPLWFSSRMVIDEYKRIARGEGTSFSHAPKATPNPPIGDAPNPPIGPYARGRSSPSPSPTTLEIPSGLSAATAPAAPDAVGDVDLIGHQLNGHAPKTVPDCPHKEILELWAKELPELAQHDPALWPESARAENLRARWRATAKLKGWTTKEDGLAYFAKLFRWCRASDFLMGRTSGGNSRRPFRFELAWLVNATNWTKVHEGRFNE